MFAIFHGAREERAVHKLILQKSRHMSIHFYLTFRAAIRLFSGYDEESPVLCTGMEPPYLYIQISGQWGRGLRNFSFYYTEKNSVRAKIFII